MHLSKSFRVATDVGGTFTDMAFIEVENDGSQRVSTAKVETTPPHFEKGVINVHPAVTKVLFEHLVK